MNSLNNVALGKL